MNHARSFLGLLVIASFAACAPSSVEGEDDEESSEESKGALTGAQGKVFATGGAGLNVRSKASTSGQVLTKLAEGKSVTIQCQVEGQSVSGTKLWDYLPAYDGYVTDAFVYTGYDGRIPGVPDCNDSDADEDVGGACNGLDYQGECAGDVLRWCEDDELHTSDCGDASKECKWQSDSIGYNCLPSGGGGGGDGLLTISEIVGGAYHYISQAYGPSDFDGGYWYCQSYGDWGGANVHCGLDVAIPYGTALYIPGDGTVVHDGDTPYFEDEANAAAGELRVRFGDGTEVILGHMSSIAVDNGQSVNAGDYAGKSGTANGGHVHIEVRVPDSGYSGGFRTEDPVQFFGE